MKETVFLDGIQAIFAAHGKRVPEQAIREAIFKRIGLLPPGFMQFAVERLEDSTDLPKNMGHYLLRELWPEYLDKHPELRSFHDRTRCPLCIDIMPGWRRVWGPAPDYEPKEVRCTCGNMRNPAFNAWPVYTDDQLIQMGYSLTCPYRYTQADFVKSRWGRFLGPKEEQRQAHVECVEEQEF